ncbi:MAG TPA: DNA starvation/stationary phase protection protein [Bacteroidales bacterium]|nr:MAG: DNA starvation/stationary phase protection protein [Bacteroidetes bacterium GWE2_42_24]OFY26059.1 MAG: DNA starvation/stationary phase protection protein [Bacteroidetes bacterium GWF2_43_11]PKP23335.1 MAG: DNA starvation/stationary phase protection protein [Bacteroidetes bacterium HGW-Bacteroidetes-22]HAQ65300.1 DNA starvation/stationary phase protection protein [Bacteroidales bacterium]HBZ65366.1 DNA starvation/stationary phase protection protein [Bacteroidales bacterium]
MKTMNQIGLDKVRSTQLIEKLNDLLANYQVFYQNTRGFHWNIKGDKFFELHLKFEELYTDLQLKIDEIAERILTLSGTPLHTFSDYLNISQVKPVSNSTDGKASVRSILDTFTILLIKQREILALSAEVNDEGTNAMASDYIRAQEKLVWMYNAFLG